MPQGTVLAQRVHHSGHRRAPLAHGAIDGDHLGARLIENGVHGHSGLARLPVADDELALPAADGDQGVHGLDAGLQGRRDRGPVHDGGGLALHRPALADPQGLAAVQHPPGGIEHPAEQALAHGGVGQPAGAPDLGPGRHPFAQPEQNHADPVDIQIHGHSEQAVGKDDELLGAHARQPRYLGDAATDADDRAHFLGAKLGSVVGQDAVHRPQGVVGQTFRHGASLRPRRGPDPGRPRARPGIDPRSI